MWGENTQNKFPIVDTELNEVPKICNYQLKIDHIARQEIGGLSIPAVTLLGKRFEQNKEYMIFGC